ncbi:hypothetical protein WR25_11958 [Diploscapter pachys]|uniref:Uncharacterized protein n=1 Tax=Diploscapter pachys TaxID=2018661 RepID=A0A2A2JW59_9BILA|nr:hypothetical protein WR25_11958 [Diploscapter pachys]
MKKQVNNQIRNLLNRLVAHFFSNSAEKEACRVIGAWLGSGDMSLQQWKQWQMFISDDQPVTLKKLRSMKWKTNDDDYHLQKLSNALDDIDKDSFFDEMEQELFEMLRCYLRPPEFKNPTKNVLEIVARTIYTCEVMENIIEEFRKDERLFEVRIHAADACIIDCDFENKIWHGKNLCIVTEKLIVQKKNALIDLSGAGYKVVTADSVKREVDGKKDGENGENGVDGRAGESSGNVAFIAGLVRGATNLSIHLNGGNGEAGTHGGNGADGRVGKGVTQADIDNTCISYGSLYRTSWNYFTDWNPPSDTWTCTLHVWNSSKQFLYREYKGTDGRKITYSLSGDVGYIYTTYDLYFLMAGGEGSMGGKGGDSGVGGEGGRKGEFQQIPLSNGRPMKVDCYIEQKQGTDGPDGKCGNSGKAGSNGNDMVMIDRSAQKKSKKYIPDDTKYKITKSYEYNAGDDTRLDGNRKNGGNGGNGGASDCYIKFKYTDIAKFAMAEAAKQRTCAQREKQSLTVTKATIVIDSVVSDFYEHFKSDAALTGSFAGNNQEWRELEVEEEEVEVEETVQQEVALVRTHIEDEGMHDWKSRAEQIDPNDVLSRIDNESLDLTALVLLFEDIFRVVLPLQDNEIVKRIHKQIEKAQKLGSQANNLPDGMSRADFKRLLDVIKSKMTKKVHLSTELLKDIAKSDKIPSDSIELVNGIVKDVMPCEIKEDVWKTIDASNPLLLEELTAFFDQLKYVAANTQLLHELYKLRTFLHKSQAIFEKFKNDKLNWAEPEAVRRHFDSFLTQKELEKREEMMKKEIEKAEKKKEDMLKKREEKAKKNNKNMQDEERNENSNDKEAEEAKEVDEDMILDSGEASMDTIKNGDQGYFKSMKTSVANWFGSSSEGEAFKDVEKIMKRKDAKIVFESFQQLVNGDQALKNRFSYPTLNMLSQNQYATPCTMPQSVIQLYFLSARILDCNMRFYRYWKLYNKSIISPKDWWQEGDSEKSAFPSYDAFMVAISDSVGMPSIDSNMCKFMITNGIRCSAYRHYISDEKQINIQVFRSSGFCKMRLVENINPHFEQVVRIFISGTGSCASVQPNLEIRKGREAIEDGSKVIPELPLSTEQEPSFYHCFNSTFKHKIEEWTHAMKVSINSNDFLRMLHEIYALRGCPYSLNEWLFTLNTAIESICNVGLSEKAVASLILKKDGELKDVWLALRILAAMKGRCTDDIETMRKQLEEIREPRLHALFGSKLHEIELNEETLNILIKMLAHADDRVVELAGMSMKEWIDIAKCQKWNDFEPLLKRYGAVGYYLVFLDSMQKPETQKLKEIIDRIAKNECFIFEKTISRLAYLISYREVDFSDEYANSVEEMLRNLSNAETKQHMISEVCEVNEPNVKKTHNIHLVVNEYVQNKVLEMDNSNIRSSLDKVFSKSERTLNDLIRLTINLQDAPKRAKEREVEMQEVKKTIEKVNNDEADDINSKTLYQVCVALEKECGVKLRETQKIAILSAIMSKRNLLSQVNTGEGKSYIIATLAIMRTLLSGYKETVDIVTSSSVLAQRDAKDMEKLYSAFGIRVSHNCDEDIEKRKEAYKCAVVYGDITRFERDYLLHSFYKKNVLGSRTRCNVIVDEVDSMLLDNGSNMLYLSHEVAGIELLEPLFVFIHRELRKPKLKLKSDCKREEDSFSSIEVRRVVLRDIFGLITREDIVDLLEEQAMSRKVGTVWRLLSKNQIIDEEGKLRKIEQKYLVKLQEDLKNECGEDTQCRVLTMLAAIRDRAQEIAIPAYLHDVALRHLDEFITNAKKAMFLEPDVEYVVDLDHTGRSGDLNAQVTIIDRGTGTDLSSSQWSEGLHQFLQLKHACRLTPLSMKAVFVSNVSYLKGYNRLNGFSGTLGSVEESKSLVSLYGADLVRIPTFKPKIFNENVPVLSTNRKKWIKDVFNEVCDQVCARRSVLIICRSIAEVKEFKVEFVYLNQLFQNNRNESDKDKSRMQECMKHLIVYEREFDEFNFSDTGFDCSRLIISTNLAGRGTDIKLSKDLIETGGLHVIISFLPENSRIEDQAYGRAARCGQPGSGQIIALVGENSSATTNIFQLKQFRDNAEVHRLRSLSDYYHYHIEIEEDCLDLFRSHCSHVLEQVYSGNNENTLPSKAQVVYFALLDEWANWIDSMTEDIKQCEKSKNQNEKTMIISKVNKFLKNHPLPEKSSSFHKTVEWIGAPQPLLAIALIDVEDETRRKEASAQLENIGRNHPYFIAETNYYLGVIAQQKIRELKAAFLEKKEGKQWKDVTWYNPLHYLQLAKDKVVPKMDEAVANVAKLAVGDIRDTPEWLITNSVEQLLLSFKYLLHSRGMLSTRIQRKAEMKRIVTLLQNTSTSILSNGYNAQCDEVTSLLETLIGNIDDMVGHTVKRDDVCRIFGKGTEAGRQSVELMRELEHCGIISEVSLSHQISLGQLQAIARSHAISATTLISVFNDIRKNEKIPETLQEEKVISSASLLRFFAMPSALGFWRSISRAGCFLHESSFVAIHKSEKVLLFNDIPQSAIPSNPFTLQLSTRNLKDCKLYNMKDVAEAIGKNAVKNIQFEEHITAGNVFIELVGILNPIVVDGDVWLDEFDYISVEDVARQLNLPRVGAEWIVQMLVKNEVLYEVRVRRNSSSDSGIEEDDSEILKNAQIELPKAVYRLKDGVNCENFPKCMRLPLQCLLARQFSYGYALKSIRSSLRKIAEGVENETESTKEKPSLSLILPEQPITDLYNDLISIGILQKQRVMQTLEEVYSDDHGLMAKVRDAFIEKKPRILLNKSTLTSTSDYFNEKCAPMGMERSRLIANGMRLVATVKKPNPWRYYFRLFIVLLPIALVVVGALAIGALVSSAIAPIIPLIALGILAAVGTTLFVINLFMSMQSD